MHAIGVGNLTVARPPGPRSDDALCRAFLAGEGAAFTELVRRHQELVYRLVRRGTTPDEARDLAQKTFLKAFEAARRSLPRLGRVGPVPFRAWLLRIAVNLSRNLAREKRRWRLEPVEGLAAADTGAPSASEALVRAEERRQVHAAVLCLPRRQREVVSLRVDGGLPFAEVAEALGITEANAKVQFSQAVKRLKGALAHPTPKEAV